MTAARLSWWKPTPYSDSASELSARPPSPADIFVLSGFRENQGQTGLPIAFTKIGNVIFLPQGGFRVDFRKTHVRCQVGPLGPSQSACSANWRFSATCLQTKRFSKFWELLKWLNGRWSFFVFLRSWNIKKQIKHSLKQPYWPIRAIISASYKVSTVSKIHVPTVCQPGEYPKWFGNVTCSGVRNASESLLGWRPFCDAMLVGLRWTGHHDESCWITQNTFTRHDLFTCHESPASGYQDTCFDFVAFALEKSVCQPNER